jgi:hypothetical protein
MDGHRWAEEALEGGGGGGGFSMSNMFFLYNMQSGYI